MKQQHQCDQHPALQLGLLTAARYPRNTQSNAVKAIVHSQVSPPVINQQHSPSNC